MIYSIATDRARQPSSSGAELETLYAYVQPGAAALGAPLRAPASGITGRRTSIRCAHRGASQSSGRRRPEALVPVINSSICLIENGRLLLSQGCDTCAFADTATLEDIAALLWHEQPPSSPWLAP